MKESYIQYIHKTTIMHFSIHCHAHYRKSRINTHTHTAITAVTYSSTRVQCSLSTGIYTNKQVHSLPPYKTSLTPSYLSPYSMHRSLSIPTSSLTLDHHVHHSLFVHHTLKFTLIHIIHQSTIIHSVGMSKPFWYVLLYLAIYQHLYC